MSCPAATLLESAQDYHLPHPFSFGVTTRMSERHQRPYSYQCWYFFPRTTADNWIIMPLLWVFEIPFFTQHWIHSEGHTKSSLNPHIRCNNSHMLCLLCIFFTLKRGRRAQLWGMSSNAITVCAHFSTLKGQVSKHYVLDRNKGLF